jgi:hypothetical protein
VRFGLTRFSNGDSSRPRFSTPGARDERAAELALRLVDLPLARRSRASARFGSSTFISFAWRSRRSRAPAGSSMREARLAP